MKALLVGVRTHGVDGAQVDPFRMYGWRLWWSLGLRCTFLRARTHEKIIQGVRDHARYDLAFIRHDWHDSSEAALKLFQTLHDLKPRPKLIYLDAKDGTSSPYLGVAPYVDRFLKKQLLKDRALYRADLLDGYYFPHRLRELGYTELRSSEYGVQAPPGYEHKLHLSWNLGVSKRLWGQYRKIQPRAWNRKTREIFCRVRFQEGPDSGYWFSAHRRDALRALEPLRAKYKVLASGGTDGDASIVPQEQYFEEMLSSKLAVSPFGWGELCWRDFEAAACGCLLVKPDVSHLETKPDIFVPYETYVPVKWDWSDLAEVCERYLADPDESQRLIANARAAYERYFSERRFLLDLKEHLEALRA